MFPCGIMLSLEINFQETESEWQLISSGCRSDITRLLEKKHLFERRGRYHTGTRKGASLCRPYQPSSYIVEVYKKIFANS